MSFSENFVRLCNKAGKSPSAVALEIGIQKPTVTRWSNGSTPRDATLIKVADYFGISTQELVGETKKAPGTEAEGELLEYLEMLRTRPELKMLFHTFKDATKGEIEAIVTAWEARNNIKGE